MSATHEDFREFARRREPSERTFGFVFTAAFLFLGLRPLLRHQPVQSWWLGMAAAIFTVTIARPSWLRLPNRGWTWLGRAMGKIVNPIVFAILFYLVFTPCATILRILGKDPLGRTFDRDARTYWIPREPAERGSNMADQF